MRDGHTTNESLPANLGFGNVDDGKNPCKRVASDSIVVTVFRFADNLAFTDSHSTVDNEIILFLVSNTSMLPLPDICFLASPVVSSSSTIPAPFTPPPPSLCNLPQTVCAMSACQKITNATRTPFSMFALFTSILYLVGGVTSLY